MSCLRNPVSRIKALILSGSAIEIFKHLRLSQKLVRVLVMQATLLIALLLLALLGGKKAVNFELGGDPPGKKQK